MKKIAVIGSTGHVGRQVVSLLLNSRLVPSDALTLFASPRSAGKNILINDTTFTIHDTQTAIFSDYDICIFNTESDISELYIPMALKAGAYVIDSSDKYRLAPSTPLIVPPVNQSLVTLSNKLYSHANCLVSPIATVIAPLHREYPIHRINASTYQATSGAGQAASHECWNETAALIQNTPFDRQVFKKQIAFNVIPQVGRIMDDGITSEEYKIINELKKVVDPSIAITVTSVRVPVLNGHSIALNIEFKAAFDLQNIIKILDHAPFVTTTGQDYKTPVEVVGSDDVFVGRIRQDLSVPHGLNLWLCSDNLRRGAATDSFEITERLLELLNK